MKKFMNRLKQNEIHCILSSAYSIVGKTLAHYKNYQPTLNHEKALEEITIVIEQLQEAERKIKEQLGREWQEAQ